MNANANDDNSDEVDTEAGSLYNDPVVDDLRAKQTVTNDAVAGETVLDGAGDGNDGPTGGSPREAEPEYAREGPGADAVQLGDKEEDGGRGGDSGV